VWQLGPLAVSKPVSLLRLWCLLIMLHIDHGLLYGLVHLILHYENLLQGWWRVSSIVVLGVIVVVGITISCVGHLKNKI
jgi:hypothetical protein